MSDDSSDLAYGDFDSALIPQEEGEGTKTQSANRATADSDPTTDPDAGADGAESTDPNAQPSA